MKYGAYVFMIVLFISGMIVFQDGFRNYFTHEILACYINYFTFADDFFIPACFRSNAFAHFPEYFPFGGGVYRPLLTCSFAIDYMVHGLNAYGYHVTSYLIHVMNAFLVFTLALFFLQNRGLAMVAAALFFFHPWNSSPIIILIQRSGLLCTGFYTASALSFIKYRTTEYHREIWLAATLCCAIGAWLSYEMYISLPFILLILDLLYFREKKEKKWFRFHTGMFLALIFTLVYRYRIFHGMGGYSGMSPESIHMVISTVMLKNYYLYPVSFLGNYIPFHYVPGILLAIISCMVLVRIVVGDKNSIFLLSWVLLTLVSVVTMRINYYYFYLPSVGFVIIIFYIMNFFIRKTRYRKLTACAIGSVMVLILIVNTAVIRAEFDRISTDNQDTRAFIEQIHNTFPDLTGYATVYIIVPDLVGKDSFSRNYFDISMEHLLQLRYGNRHIRCYPLTVAESNGKYSRPASSRENETVYFIQREGHGIIQYKNLSEALAALVP